MSNQNNAYSKHMRDMIQSVKDSKLPPEAMAMDQETRALFEEANNRAKEAFIVDYLRENFWLQQKYLEKVNNIACGIPVKAVPWDKDTPEWEIQEIVKKYPEFEEDYLLELYETKCLSMGHDPTEGMFKQFTPGYPVLTLFNYPTTPSSLYPTDDEPMVDFSNMGDIGEMAHAIHEQNMKNNEGEFIPRLDINPTLPTQNNGTTELSDEAFQRYIAIEKRRDEMEEREFVGPRPVPPIPVPYPQELTDVERQMMIRQYPTEYVNCRFLNFYIPYIPVPETHYFDENIKEPNENSNEEYKEYYKRYMRDKYYEQHKQELYNDVAELVIYKQSKLNVQMYYMYDAKVYNMWVREIQELDNDIAEAQARLPKPRWNDPEWIQEQQILEYNFKVKQYNERKFKYLETQIKRCHVARGVRVANVISMDEIIADGGYYDPVSGGWFDRYGTPLTMEAEAYVAAATAEAESLRSIEVSKLRNDIMYKNTFEAMPEYVKKLKEEGYSEKEAERIYNEEDPYGYLAMLRSPGLQTDTSNPDDYKTQPWHYSDYNSFIGKRRCDFTKDDEARLHWYYQNMKCERFQPYTQYEYIRNHSPFILPEFQFDRIRAPYSAAANKAAIESSRYSDPDKRRQVYEDVLNEEIKMADYRAEKMKMPSSYAGWYDEDKFLECLDNYGHKTNIGRMSDLLNDFDNNESFRTALNKDVLRLTLPSEMGFEYNKRRVEFDNSILEQFDAIGKPFPPGARIKDPMTETYDDRPLEEIEKEVYAERVKEAKRIKQYLSPELGGTYDGKKSEPSNLDNS